MTIINMAGGGGNNINVPLNGISDLTASSGDGQAVIKRTDVGDLVVNGVTVNEWSCTKLVRKTGSAPASSNDGTPVLTETLENAYSVTGYTNTGLTNGTTYYYGAFSVGTNGLETISNIATVTPLARWQPGENTLLYLPLESDVVDQSGKTGRTFTTSGISFTTVGGVPSVHIGNNGGISLTAPNPIVTTASTEQTISFWIYFADGVISARRFILGFTKQNNMDTEFALLENTSKLNLYGASSWSTQVQILEQGVWKHIACVNSSAGAYVYVNGVLASTSTGSSTPRGIYGFSYEQGQFIGNGRSGLSSSEGLRGNMRELIFEDKTWTAQEVANYYNQTKSDYGF